MNNMRNLSGEMNNDISLQKKQSTFDNHYLTLVTFDAETEIAYRYLMIDDVIKGEKRIEKEW